MFLVGDSVGGGRTVSASQAWFDRRVLPARIGQGLNNGVEISGHHRLRQANLRSSQPALDTNWQYRDRG